MSVSSRIARKVLWYFSFPPHLELRWAPFVMDSLGCSSFKLKQPEPEGEHRPLSQMKNKKPMSLYLQSHVFFCSLMFNFLERTGKCTYRPVNRKKTAFCSQSVFTYSALVFAITNAYIPNLLSPICFSNRSTVYSLWGTTWIMVYNAD
jgi:hypothetical protein